MSFWSKLGWGGSTIQARDSDELMTTRASEGLMRSYAATEQLTLDYSKNFKALNEYAALELKRLPDGIKEDLMKLPLKSRLKIYKDMHETFSEADVEAAGGWREFMSTENQAMLGTKAETLVIEGVRRLRFTKSVDRDFDVGNKKEAAAGKDADSLIGKVDEDIGVEMQELVNKDTNARDGRERAARLHADKEEYARQHEAYVTQDAEAQKLLDDLDALLDSEDDDILPDDVTRALTHEEISNLYGNGAEPVGDHSGAVEMQVIEPKAAAPPADGLGVDFDPFAAEPIASGEAATGLLPGTVKRGFGGKVGAAVKNAGKRVAGLFKGSGAALPEPVEENPLIIRGPPPDEMDGKESETGARDTLRGDYDYRRVATEDYDETELTSLLRKTAELGPESAVDIKPSRQEPRRFGATASFGSRAKV